MKAASKNYKGIEYVQISSLPDVQRKHIHESLNHKLIIHILKDDSLLNDCLQYQHYLIWYENVYQAISQEQSSEVYANSPALTLALR